MAKHTPARRAKSKKTKNTGKLFVVDLEAINKSIGAVAKAVRRGGARADKRVKEAETAGPNSAARKFLKENQEAQARAKALLLALEANRKLMSSLCCQNDENCNFVVF